MKKGFLFVAGSLLNKMKHRRSRLSCWALILSFAFVFLTVPVFGTAAVAPRVAVYVDEGACGDNLLALFRALQSTGFNPLGVTAQSIAAGCLTKDNFDVFVLPAGENGSPLGYAKHFDDTNRLYNYPRLIEKNILDFVSNGGGVLGIESGAYYFSAFFHFVQYDLATYNKYSPFPGVKNFKIIDNQFGSATQAAYMCTGGGYFSNVNPGTTGVIAIDPQNMLLNQAVLIRSVYGKGRIILCAFDPELRWDSDLDWTAWNKWNYGSFHTNSEGAWKLLGSMTNWTANGTNGVPEIIATNPKGVRVALVTTHNDAGGAASALLPAFARAIEYAGHIPLAIRCSDIQKGYLKNDDFKVVAFPGGTVGGYTKELDGHESKILDFVRNGGSFYGVCAGSYYASRVMMWDGNPNPGPLLGLFKGTDAGPISEICPWPYYTMVPVKISDPVIGDLGIINILYYGGGHKSKEQGVDIVATYIDGKVDAIRFTYGLGRGFLSGTHPEIRPDILDNDWLYWDKFPVWASEKQSGMLKTNRRAVRQDNKEERLDTSWFYEKAIFNKWLVHSEQDNQKLSQEEVSR